MRITHCAEVLVEDSGIIGNRKNFSVRSSTHPELSKRNRQDGFKEYLLCGNCEERFGNFESYAKEMLFSATSPIVIRPSGHYVWTGLGYKRMKLFCMSILWRMGVSADPFYNFVELGSEEETLRQMLLSDEPGEEWQYGCMIALLRYRGRPLVGTFLTIHLRKSVN
jgi:hypothetical protein